MTLKYITYILRGNRMELNNNMKDITGDPKKAVKKLAYPIIISMLLIMSNNLIDSIWVAGLGPEPLAIISYFSRNWNRYWCRCKFINFPICRKQKSVKSKRSSYPVNSFRYYCFHNSYSYFCSNSRTDTLYHGCEGSI